MFIYFAIFGFAILITGIILIIKFKNKIGSILMWVGVVSVVISVVLFTCTLLLIYGQDDNDPISSIDSIGIDICEHDWRACTDVRKTMTLTKIC